MRSSPLTRSRVLCLALGVVAAGGWPVESARAQAPEFVWARRDGGVNYNRAQAVAVDGEGNVVVTGEFEGTAGFGSVTLTSAGERDVFVAKYDPSGEVVWARRAGGNAWDIGYGLAVDEAGNVVVTGRFQATASFGSLTLTGAGSGDMFVAKYDPSGEVVWARGAGGAELDFGYGAAGDDSGNVIVTGEFQGTASFGSVTLTSAGWIDLFLAKYDPSGEVVWARRAGGADYDGGYGIAADGFGNILVTGRFYGTANFGPVTLTNDGSLDMFVAKFNSSGDVEWAHSAGGTGEDFGYGVAADKIGNVIVTGDYQGTASFGSVTLTSEGFEDVFVASYDPSGELVWVRGAGGEGADFGYGVAVDGSGNVVVSGVFQGTASFGPLTRTSLGPGDVFIASYSPSGEVVWVQDTGGTGAGSGLCVSVGSPGNVVVAGFFWGTLTFGSTTLTSTAEEDIFVARLGEPTTVHERAGLQPGRFALLPNYPNPFNAETRLRYTLPWAAPQRTALRVYNVSGEAVRTLVDAVQGAGEYEVVWDGKDDSGRVAASGIYLCRLASAQRLEVMKLTLLK